MSVPTSCPVLPNPRSPTSPLPPHHPAVPGYPAAPSTNFVLGTRRSQLALVQTNLVADALRALHPEWTFVVEAMTTAGDRNQTTPLHLLSPYSSSQPAKSLWTDELEAKLTVGELDMLVHSLKDVPTVLKDGCELACMLEREDPRDALVMRDGRPESTLAELAPGSVVGTGSVRRVAQLKRAHPQLVFQDMRGNLNTRFRKLDDPASPFAALILALSGLTRVNMQHRATAPLSSPELFHAVGQGALGVEIRTSDDRVRQALRGAGHWPTEWRCGAERGCLRVLEGGCSVPVGIETELEEVSEAPEGAGEEEPLTANSPTLHFSGLLDRGASYPKTAGEKPVLRKRYARMKLRGCVTSLDGQRQVVRSAERVVGSYRQAEKFGEDLARMLKAEGAGEILDEINAQRRERERKDLEKALEASRQAAALSGAKPSGPLAGDEQGGENTEGSEGRSEAGEDKHKPETEPGTPVEVLLR